MTPKKKRVFLTGVTGSMGGAALRELLTRTDRFDIVTLVRPSKKNRKALQAYDGDPALQVVWGDLTNYGDVLRCVTGVDYVLHPAALISPEADHKPDEAWAINVGSVTNIVDAIRAQPDPDTVRLVSIGTVAATGDRLPPIHWGRCGDPLKPSVYDMYACSKIAAERLVAESGLRYWVSLRQTFIAIPETRSLMDPIMFHQPIDTCIEFCTLADAGRVLANVCEDDVPDEFWRRFYNIGGGDGCRVTYLELLGSAFAALRVGEPTQLFDRNWFALRNFHCHWFDDSDVLERYLSFRSENVDALLRQMVAASPWYERLAAPVVPTSFIRKFVLEPLATRSADCPMYWIDRDVTQRISAFFKSREQWQSIPPWGTDMPSDPREMAVVRLEHGYDEEKDVKSLNLTDMTEAADFRGGLCVSSSMTPGSMHERLRWQCARGHHFTASPNVILKGGHWCDECMPPGWRFDEEARINPFFAQVWYPNHDAAEDNAYSADCYRDIQA